jgi:hypothetical protein
MKSHSDGRIKATTDPVLRENLLEGKKIFPTQRLFAVLANREEAENQLENRMNHLHAPAHPSPM